MIGASKHTHVITNPVRLGNMHLYKASAYKAKDADKPSGKPKYDLVLAFDKTKDADTIKAIKAAQDAAIQRLIDRGEWDDQTATMLCFKDADVAKVMESAQSKRKVILSEKRPELEGKWCLKLTSKATRRPTVKYVDADGLVRGMPEPILDPDEDDAAQVAEAERVRDMWDSLVYPGQNAVVSFTFGGWVSPIGQGTSANIDNILILGGGAPAGTVSFDSDFDAARLDEVRDWVSAHRGAGVTRGVEDAEPEPEPEPETEPEPEPRRKPKSRRKPVEADYDPVDGFDDDDAVSVF